MPYSASPKAKPSSNRFASSHFQPGARPLRPTVRRKRIEPPHGEAFRTAKTKPVRSFKTHVKRGRRQAPKMPGIAAAGRNAELTAASQNEEAVQVACALSGISQIAFRHALACDPTSGDLDAAYQRFIAEVGKIDVYVIDAPKLRGA